jgi:hypothetical protein
MFVVNPVAALERSAPETEPGVSLNPIEGLVLQYHDDLLTDNLPTDARQQRLRQRIIEGDDRAPGQLVDDYMGLIAVIVYDFNRSGTDASVEEMVGIGSGALVDIALELGDEELPFEDHAIPAIGKALAERVGIDSRYCTSPSERPMHDLYTYVPKLKADIEKDAENQKILKDFWPMERKVLPLLHLAPRAIREKLIISQDKVHRVVASAKTKVEAPTPTVTALAIALQEMGLKYDLLVPQKPLVKLLTNEEMELGYLLGLPNYDEIAGRMGPNYEDASDVKVRVDHMRRQLKARSTTELALMIRKFDTGERRDTDIPPPIRKLETLLGRTSLQAEDVRAKLAGARSIQRDAVEGYFLGEVPLPWRVVGENLGVSESHAFRQGMVGVKVLDAAFKSEEEKV